MTQRQAAYLFNRLLGPDDQTPFAAAAICGGVTSAVTTLPADTEGRAQAAAWLREWADALEGKP